MARIKHSRKNNAYNKKNKTHKKKNKVTRKPRAKKSVRKSKKAGFVDRRNLFSASVSAIQQIVSNLTPEKIQFLGVLMISKEQNITLIYDLFNNNNNNNTNEDSHLTNIKNLYDKHRDYNKIMPFSSSARMQECAVNRNGQPNNQLNYDRTTTFKNAFISGGPSNPGQEQGKFSIISNKSFYRSNIVLMQLLLYRLFQPNDNNLFLEILAYIIRCAKTGVNKNKVVDFLTATFVLDDNIDKYYNRTFSGFSSIQEDLTTRVRSAYIKYDIGGKQAPDKITERYMFASLISTISVYNVENTMGSSGNVKVGSTAEIQCKNFLTRGIHKLVEKIKNPKEIETQEIKTKWENLLFERRGSLGVSSNFNVNVGGAGNYDIFRNGILQKQAGIIFPSLLELFTFLFIPKVKYITSVTPGKIDDNVNMKAEPTSILGYFNRNNKVTIESSSHRDEFRLIFKDKINTLLDSQSSVTQSITNVVSNIADLGKTTPNEETPPIEGNTTY